MIKTFQDQWLDDYYFFGVKSSNIPSTIESALKRKLDIIHAAKGERDLRVPPGNRFEHLEGKLKDWCSIRVNKQYRLIFQWDTGEAKGLYLDPHTYK
ncbi:type II toxin-antitoxin system RelE/ParE family toxin [Porticoccaceae bacterium]|nr:type II toxin-antitoxin system RelE/ParE family toxin [Porticoccaceae bacterium]MDB2343801.1 type II toxin-antitoxin system RelE/ParE family toxin [Porticoccaceae bacterium]